MRKLLMRERHSSTDSSMNKGSDIRCQKWARVRPASSFHALIRYILEDVRKAFPHAMSSNSSPSPKTKTHVWFNKKDKGLKFRSYMIRVKSVKGTGQSKVEMPAWGEVFATQKRQTKTKTKKGKKRRIWHASCGKKKAARTNPFPSDPSCWRHW